MIMKIIVSIGVIFGEAILVYGRYFPPDLKCPFFSSLPPPPPLWLHLIFAVIVVSTIIGVHKTIRYIPEGASAGEEDDID
jgi:hypothetical protein